MQSREPPLARAALPVSGHENDLLLPNERVFSISFPVLISLNTFSFFFIVMPRQSLFPPAEPFRFNTTTFVFLPFHVRS